VSNELQIGQAVKLIVAGATPPASVMAVVVAKPPPRLVVALGSGVAAPPGLVVGAQVSVSFTTANLFAQAKTSVLRVLPERPVSVELAPLAQLSASQRRRFFRVPASLLTLLVVSTARASELGRQDGRALTQDVSAGGLRVETTLPLAIGDRVQVTVETPRGLRRSQPSTLVCEAEVVHAAEVVRKGRKLCSAGLQFVFASSSEQDRWVKLTFDLQRGPET
jgi:c-di-GMP-binding flagellar brake protein YcgR